jgi:hypothetical protein
MVRRSLFCAILSGALLGGFSVSGDDGIVPQKLGPAAGRLLVASVGDPDPLVPHRIARALGPTELTAAFYRGTRTERLVALDAAASTALADPFAVLPSLAALMGARDRQVASRATRALYSQLRRKADRPTAFSETVPGQISQLREQLMPLALDRRLDTDVRGVALLGIGLLESELPETDQTWMLDLLSDPEMALRRASITALRPPLEESLLNGLAKTAIADPDLGTRGYAAAMICENALSHGVEEPSADLTDLLKNTLENTQIPVDALGGVLACIAHFKGDRRADLVDLALAHPDPAVAAYWKSQKQR